MQLVKSKQEDEFVLVEELAQKAFPKSKTPICDYVTMFAGECDPEEPVINLDIARQLEYNSRYYEQKTTPTKRWGAMQLVSSREEIDSIRPYPICEFTKYPESYPAFVEFELWSNDNGLDYYEAHILEVPKDVDADSFIMGVLSKAKQYHESEAFRKNEND
jgi:hypothetical protein